ncbi:hypothetical protein LXL04_017399 [Taraxacum kok-saghyz]
MGTPPPTATMDMVAGGGGGRRSMKTAAKTRKREQRNKSLTGRTRIDGGEGFQPLHSEIERRSRGCNTPAAGPVHRKRRNPGVNEPSRARIPPCSARARLSSCRLELGLGSFKASIILPPALNVASDATVEIGIASTSLAINDKTRYFNLCTFHHSKALNELIPFSPCSLYTPSSKYISSSNFSGLSKSTFFMNSPYASHPDPSDVPSFDPETIFLPRPVPFVAASLTNVSCISKYSSYIS